MQIDIIVGARPNFMKVAPIIESIQSAALHGNLIGYRLIHTGQHYDKKMSGVFFDQLGIPEPDVNLEAGSGTQAEQTAAIMIGFEKELISNPADLVLVVGDVTSTMACSIVAKKLNVKVAHVEAGIRSFDLGMPEEINRMVTDSITDYFFTTSETANKNLYRLGVSKKKVFFVGNTMIDTLLKHMDRLQKPAIWDQAKLRAKNYIITTLHRPANVDGENKLKVLLEEIIKHSQGLPVIFPVHPRTAKVLSNIGLYAENLILMDPLSYLEFNYLVKNAKVIITDSGGITEETTVMGVPCMTLRDSTERPETCSIGTNRLLGTDPKNIAGAFKDLFEDKWQKGSIPEMWDGHSGKRIVDILCGFIKEN